MTEYSEMLWIAIDETVWLPTDDQQQKLWANLSQPRKSEESSVIAQITSDGPASTFA